LEHEYFEQDERTLLILGKSLGRLNVVLIQRIRREYLFRYDFF